jgi:hypothetical protein
VSSIVGIAAKDNSCKPKSESGDELLHMDLADKAKQVKKLHEEFIAKSEQKDRQIAPVTRERDEALVRCNSRETEINKTIYYWGKGGC